MPLSNTAPRSTLEKKLKLLIHTEHWQKSLLLIHLELVSIKIIQIVLLSIRIQHIINLVPFFLYINNPYSYFFFSGLQGMPILIHFSKNTTFKSEINSIGDLSSKLGTPNHTSALYPCLVLCFVCILVDQCVFVLNYQSGCKFSTILFGLNNNCVATVPNSQFLSF